MAKRIPVEKLKSPDPQTIVAKLVRGKAKLGEGLYARVYRKNRNTVMRVTSADDPYIKYLKHIGLNAKNPYFPRITKVTRISIIPGAHASDGKDIFITEMEYLQDYHSVPRTEREKAFKRLGCWETGDERDLERGRYFKPTTKKGKELRKVLRDVNGYDCHEENVMFRESGGKYHLVVTDPVC